MRLCAIITCGPNVFGRRCTLHGSPSKEKTSGSSSEPLPPTLERKVIRSIQVSISGSLLLTLSGFIQGPTVSQGPTAGIDVMS